MIEMKKILISVLAVVMMLSSVNIFAYTVEDAYWEFKQKHPEFVSDVVNQGVSEKTLLDFLNDVRDYMLEMSRAEAITESNFEKKAITAITRVSSREKFVVYKMH